MSGLPTAKRILLVEDDQDMRNGLRLRLQSEHYTVSVAPDAVAAVSAAQRERPDLILVDIGLPGGDGFLVMQRLSALQPLAGIPVFVITARSEPENLERARALGAQGFFRKPINSRELMSAVRRVIG